MPIHCFTSISFSYLAKARVLGWSLKRYHPDWTIWVCITDTEPEGFNFDIESEPFDRVLFATDLDIPNLKGWLFMHDVVEVCTAVKGPILKMLLDEGTDKVIYLDPDIAVFNTLQPLVELLDVNSIVLTPHQIEPDYEAASIYDNEIGGSLKHGAYNLGFVAVSNDEQGRSFAHWWADRCLRFCYDDLETGLFVDQKWCDLVPAFFDGVLVLRDPGYNVASWNLNRRSLSISPEGKILVNNDYPLRFYHFTKLGPIGDTMTRRYAGDNIEVYEVWAWYKAKVDEFTDPGIPDGWWSYGVYSNGEAIPKEARTLYRHRGDLQSAYPDPFDASAGGMRSWYIHEHLGNPVDTVHG